VYFQTCEPKDNLSLDFFRQFFAPVSLAAAAAAAVVLVLMVAAATVAVVGHHRSAAGENQLAAAAAAAVQGQGEALPGEVKAPQIERRPGGERNKREGINTIEKKELFKFMKINELIGKKSQMRGGDAAQVQLK